MAKSVNPILKKIIQNMDLDLGSELNRYEENQDSDSVTILPVVETKTDEVGSFSPSSSLSYNPSNVYDEAIPVASRWIGDRTSLLDLILTPWGISGIILFFTANLVIFLNFEQLIAVSNQGKMIESEEIIPEEIDKSQEINTSEINQENNLVNQVEKESKKTPEKPEKPNIPPQLSSVENVSPPNNQPVLPPSPHKNLETALWQEIQPQNLSPLPSNSAPTAIPALPQTSSNPTINNQNNSNQVVNTPNDSPPVPPKTPQKYYVLTDYENMDKYNRMRSKFPDAYLMNLKDKMTINLGVFYQEKEALQHSQKLENKGIKTYIITSDTIE